MRDTDHIARGAAESLVPCYCDSFCFIEELNRQCYCGSFVSSYSVLCHKLLGVGLFFFIFVVMLKESQNREEGQLKKLQDCRLSLCRIHNTARRVELFGES